MNKTQIRLGDEAWLIEPVARTSIEQLLDQGEETLFDAVEWGDDTQYDDGWMRGGHESFYRVGNDMTEEPVFIEKSGNPRQTLDYGQQLDDAGGVVIPTVMMVADDAVDDVSISGQDYTIIQKYVPETFTERYKDNRVTDQAIEDLGRNAAALDKEGFAPTQPERQPGEMLSDGDHTYLVDFGADIGAGGYDPRDDMYQASLEQLAPEDHHVFETGYEAVRGELPDSDVSGGQYR